MDEIVKWPIRTVDEMTGDVVGVIIVAWGVNFEQVCF
jgi:hypothetical protein